MTHAAAGAGTIRSDNVRIAQQRGAFWLSCRVEACIRAPAAAVWGLLTDAPGFPRWNSTVTRIDGEIREGARLQVHAPGTERVFTPRVSDVVPPKGMTWTGGFGPVFKGVRTFELKRRPDGATDFVMCERFSGLLIPFLRRSLPDFGPIFARYAMDLKREAERATG
ncbi:MAG TPA: SRPBCC domain-containing protein [Gemmatimonadaceae bacterium]|nr:SRPBCC domain-containing protein [Gemmatimonadaceae bacterium]